MLSNRVWGKYLVNCLICVRFKISFFFIFIKFIKLVSFIFFIVIYIFKIVVITNIKLNLCLYYLY